ncbi:hypothetical protein TNCT_185121 [Trichonephila clavata]|uniref:Uncharacterized protein n=1 Tax=Trichonephila clavata TaxID=2740835 RepID=A0A8X6GFI5_TRICU|nr:hypothetical protein TNCT_185121 [Trichonephila clavata]
MGWNEVGNVKASKMWTNGVKELGLCWKQMGLDTAAIARGNSDIEVDDSGNIVDEPRCYIADHTPAAQLNWPPPVTNTIGRRHPRPMSTRQLLSQTCSANDYIDEQYNLLVY